MAQTNPIKGQPKTVNPVIQYSSWESTILIQIAMTTMMTPTIKYNATTAAINISVTSPFLISHSNEQP